MANVIPASEVRTNMVIKLPGTKPAKVHAVQTRTAIMGTFVDIFYYEGKDLVQDTMASASLVRVVG